MHDCKGKSRQFFALNFSIKEQRFDVQGEIYGLVICHNRVILREIDEKLSGMALFLFRAKQNGFANENLKVT